MSDLPIPFNSPPMVRALLREIDQPGTGKTQTRRVLAPACDEPPAFICDGVITALDENEDPYRWPRTYAPGDRLWVKEAWRTTDGLNALTGKQIEKQCRDAGYTRPWCPLQYEADQARENWIADPHSFGAEPGRYRHARFMPRWTSRITLLVADVRVERLQEITEADAIAEGVEQDAETDAYWGATGKGLDGATRRYICAIDALRDLWTSLHGPGAWEANPWVAAITFRPVLGNIDQIGETA